MSTGTHPTIKVIRTADRHDTGTYRAYPSARLLRWLDEGVEPAGQRFQEIRRRLVWYFDRHGSRIAEELADETFRLIDRRLAFQGAIADCPPARYCYLVARLLAIDRRILPPTRRSDANAPTAAVRIRAAEISDLERRPHLMRRLDERFSELRGDDRQLLIDFYGGLGPRSPTRRLRLARRLRISLRALAARAHRVRCSLLASL
jgi:hypothetical protein